jgi:HPt (histidine-containing phosphotransfer) domain-containing protein
MTSGLQDGAESLADDPLFEALAARSRLTNIDRVEQIARLLAHCRDQGRTAPEDCVRLADLAHQVVGSAGTFGYAPVSDLGRDFEELLARSDEPSAAVLAELDELAAAMLADLNPR